MSDIRDIVNVDISIEQPASESASFSNMLIVTDAPASPIGTIPTSAFKATGIGTLTGYGWNNGAQADPVCKAFATAMAQSPRPNQVYVIVRRTVEAPTYSTTENYNVGDYCTHSNNIYICITATTGTWDSSKWQEDSGVEHINKTLDRALENGDWYGFTIACTWDAQMLTEGAVWAESNEKMFGFTWSSGACPINIKNYTRTFAIYGGNTESGVNNEYSATAWMAKCFGFEAGSETWAHKSLNNIEVSALTDAQAETIQNDGGNYYRKYANRKCTLDGKLGSGEWIDVIRFKDWLVNEIKVNITALFANNTKIPYTDAGITAVQNVITEILKKGQSIGGISPDSYDAEGNTIYGYTVTVPRASEVSAVDKGQRKLTGVTFNAKLAGAIHYAEITGRLIY